MRCSVACFSASTPYAHMQLRATNMLPRTVPPLSANHRCFSSSASAFPAPTASISSHTRIPFSPLPLATSGAASSGAAFPSPHRRRNQGARKPREVKNLNRPREKIDPELVKHSINLRLLLQRDKFADANFLLQQLEQNQPRPNLVMYHMYISALAKRGRSSEAFAQLEFLILASLLSHSQEKQPTRKPDCHTYNSVMRGYLEVGKYGDAMALFARMRENGTTPDTYSFTYLLQAISKAKQLEKIPGIFRTMDRYGVPRHTAHYNIVITSFAAASRFPEMSKYLADMRLEKILPDAWTYSALLTGFTQANDIEKAVEVFRMAKAAKKLTVAIATQMLNLFLKRGRAEDAFDILKQMHELRIEPGPTTYGVLLDAFYKRGDTAKAKVLLEDMARRGISGIYFSTIALRHLFAVGDATRARAHFKEMLDNGPAPTVVTFNCYLDGILKSSPKAGPSEVSALLETMHERKVPPDSITYAIVIGLYVKQGSDGIAAAERFLAAVEENHTTELRACCYHPLLRTHFENGHPDAAVAAYERMKRAGASPTFLSHRHMVYGFLKLDDPENAEKYLPNQDVELRAQVIACYLRLRLPAKAAALRERAEEYLEEHRKRVQAGEVIDELEQSLLPPENVKWS